MGTTTAHLPNGQHLELGSGTVEAWRYAVACGDTQLGLADWALQNEPGEHEPRGERTTLTSAMELVYLDSRGDEHAQPWDDVATTGGLVNPVDSDNGDDDMELVGWVMP